MPGNYHNKTLADVERVCRVRACGSAAARGAPGVPGAVPGEPTLIKPEANTNITCGKTLIPAVRYTIASGETYLVTEVTVA